MRAARCGMAAAGVVIALLAAGCGTSSVGGTPEPGGSPGTAGATTTRASASTTSSQERLAPPVTNPKNLRGLDPCELLTAAQLTELGMTGQPEKGRSEFGEDDCTWKDSAIYISIAPDTKRQGLEEVYRRKSNVVNFQPSTVDGYPAVRANFTEKFCNVSVGVADDQVFHLTYGIVTSKKPEHQDTCGFAEKVSGMVLQNLPAGG